jgi:ABC-type phosphate/phosphonate transport system substrate-binding protein
MAQRYARWLSQLQEEMSSLLEESVVFRLKLFKQFNQNESSLAQGDADVMVLSAVEFVRAQTLTPGIVPLAMDTSKEEAVIFARANAGLTQLANLAGTRFAAPDPDLSITAWAKAHLAGVGLQPKDFLSWTNFLDLGSDAGPHPISFEQTVLAVLQDRADAGVAYRRLFERKKHLGLVLLDSYTETPNVLAARAGLDDDIIQALRDALLSFKGQAQRESFYLPVDMVPATDTDFDPLRHALHDGRSFGL